MPYLIDGAREAPRTVLIAEDQLEMRAINTADGLRATEALEADPATRHIPLAG